MILCTIRSINSIIFRKILEMLKNSEIADINDSTINNASYSLSVIILLFYRRKTWKEQLHISPKLKNQKEDTTFLLDPK